MYIKIHFVVNLFNEIRFITKCETIGTLTKQNFGAHVY